MTGEYLADFGIRGWWSVLVLSPFIYGVVKFLHARGFPPSSLWSPAVFSFSIPFFVYTISDDYLWIAFSKTWLFLIGGYGIWSFVVALLLHIPQMLLCLLNLYEVVRDRLVMSLRKKVIIIAVLQVMTAFLYMF